MTNRPRSGCAINVAVEVLGDNWSLIVLRDIIFGGRRHFRELLTLNDEGIASNILASRLKKLVDEGLLTKAEAVRGQRAEYSLAEAGVETLPVMVALGTWDDPPDDLAGADDPLPPHGRGSSARRRSHGRAERDPPRHSPPRPAGNT